MSLQTDLPVAAAKPPVHWPSVLQFAGSVITLALLFTGAAGMAAVGLFGAVTGVGSAETLAVLLTAASFLGIAVLLLPSAYYSLMRMMGKPARDFLPTLRRLPPGLWLLFFPVVLLIGFAAERTAALAWLVLPALHVLALGLPIAWMVAIAVRGLPLGSDQRAWGVFNAGLALGPLVISVLEIIAAILLISVAVIFVIGQPEIVADLEALAQTMQSTTPLSEEQLLQELGPYVLRPGVLFGVLALVAVIVPLIEEALKPIGVWLLAGRPLSGAAGFAAGALSGAGFALTESMLLSSNGGGWVELVLVRVGTGSIHIVTTALTGWALAIAWKRRKFGTLALTYLTVVLIHALWNGLTVATVFAGLAIAQGRPEALPWASRLAPAAPLALVILAIGSLALLVFFNRRLAHTVARRTAPLSPPPESLPVSEPLEPILPPPTPANGETPGNVL